MLLNKVYLLFDFNSIEEDLDPKATTHVKNSTCPFPSLPQGCICTIPASFLCTMETVA